MCSSAWPQARALDASAAVLQCKQAQQPLTSDDSSAATFEPLLCHARGQRERGARRYPASERVADVKPSNPTAVRQVTLIQFRHACEAAGVDLSSAVSAGLSQARHQAPERPVPIPVNMANVADLAPEEHRCAGCTVAPATAAVKVSLLALTHLPMQVTALASPGDCRRGQHRPECCQVRASSCAALLSSLALARAHPRAHVQCWRQSVVPQAPGVAASGPSPEPSQYQGPGAHLQGQQRGYEGC